MTPELVIFDCDGVLVDSEGPMDALVVEDLAAHGFLLGPGEFHERFVGGTMANIEERLRVAGADLPADWEARIYEKTYALMAGGMPVSAGTHQVLDWIEAQGSKVAVASNGPMKKMAGSLGPSGLFARLEGRIFSAHDHGTSKPEPGLLLAACAQAGVDPARAIMVDDTPVGAAAAKAAGTGFLGYVEHGQAAAMQALGVTMVASMAALRGELEALGLG
ncbi:HAD-IA family hydrolase [Vannielia sp.]|uniref:HAD family hydrolase n=1 Tax=Vannielia sp. TaxID=2813045 RepID=UPI0026060736|nr:HAD-IA family hydrolase [Vannielia sp.]MDF1872035.1 HAD-IA family hydrolase [Vannielia sp.]